MSLVCVMLFTFELSFRYTVIFSYDCNKCCWNPLTTLAVSEAYTTFDKKIFVSSKFVLNGIDFLQ